MKCQKLLMAWFVIGAIQGCSSKETDISVDLVSPVTNSGTQQLVSKRVEVRDDKPDINLSEPGLPKPGLGLDASTPAVNAPVPQPSDPLKVTLYSESGHMLTAWSRRTNAYLWAYYPSDAESFGDLRHWIVERGTQPGTVQLRNADTDECLNEIDDNIPLITKFLPGRYTHAACNGPASDIKLEPVEGGGFLLRSVATNLCMSIAKDTAVGGFGNYVLQSQCPDRGETPLFSSMVWYFASSMDPSLASIAKAEIRISPVEPIVPPEGSGSHRGKMKANSEWSTEQ